MTFNTEGICIVREVETTVVMESENIEEIKYVLLLHMLQMEFDDEVSLRLLSVFISDKESMAIASDKNSDGETNTNSSYSSSMSSTSIETSVSDTISFEEDDTGYKGRLLFLSQMVNISVVILSRAFRILCYTAIRYGFKLDSLTTLK